MLVTILAYFEGSTRVEYKKKLVRPVYTTIKTRN